MGLLSFRKRRSNQEKDVEHAKTVSKRLGSSPITQLWQKGTSSKDASGGASSHLMILDAETASSRSHGDYCSSELSSTLELALQFQNKIRDSSNRASSVALRAKLEELDVKLSTLHFSDNELVGREEEIEQLRSTLKEYRKATYPTSRLISISGISGTGKTVLAQKLKRPVLKAGGYFCLGKFDLNANRAQPYMAFAAASNELADQILELEPSKVEDIQEKIQAALGDQGVHLLLEVFPGLARVVEASKTNEVIHASVEQKTNQLQFTVRQLFRVLSHHRDSPFVLVLDDVQWADLPSLNLVEALLTDRETSFLLIATSRSNEISDEHPFMKKVESIRESAISVDMISIGNLTEKSVQSVVANAMRESEDYTNGLAAVVFEKTLGNAFFVVQFMNMLVDNDLLSYNLGLMKWIWEDGEIEALSVADNVGSLLAEKIQKLPESAQTLLKTASCLGQVFEEATLSGALASLVEAGLLESAAADDVIKEIELCIESGLLELKGSKYCFVHDQIQAASYRLIPEDALPKLQLEIGRGLLKQCEGDASSDDVLFMAVDLCNSGLSLVSEEQARIGLAFQNLKAAEKALNKSSAFDAAIAYAQSAFLCLEPVRGEDDLVKYLKLKLNTVLAESSLCIGDGPRTEEYSDKVIASDFPFGDRFVGYTTKMLSQFAHMELDESAKTSLFILRNLGYVKNVSHKPNLMRVFYEIGKTQNLMKTYTEADLLNLPLMTDENRLRAMNIVYRAINMTFSSNPNLFLVLSLSAMRWTVKYGVCKYSPPMLAVYGLIVCGVLEDFDTGNMIGEVALALSERLQATQTIASTASTVFAFVKHWKHDMRIARKPMEFAHLTGLQMGDINNALINLTLLDHNSLLTGYHDLKELESITRESVTKMRSFGNDYFAAEHVTTWQYVLNLQGKVEDPLVLTGEAMDQEDALKHGQATNHKMVKIAILYFCGLLGYYYEDHEYAVANLREVKKEDCLGYVTIPRHLSFQVLACLALALEGESARQNLSRAKSTLKIVRRWVDKGNPNIAHLICLIEAEIVALTTPDKAGPMFETAIRVATRAGYRHDRALAHARAARFFFVDMKDDHWGSYHIDKSIQAYCEWGAVGVAKHLAHKYVVSEKSRRFSQEIDMSDRTKSVVSAITAL